MLGWIKQKFAEAGNRAELHSGTQLAPVPDPKVKGKGQGSWPSYLTSTKTNPGSTLPLTDRRLANVDLETFRGGLDTRTVIRDLANASPDLSAALNAYRRVALTERYTAVARNMDGTFSRDATSLLQQLLTRFDVVGDYTDGFSGITSLRSISESWIGELVLYGSIDGELVLGKDRLPRSIQPISTVQIFFRPDTKWLKPFQKVGGDEIDLDVPTFFHTSIDQDLLQPYATSMFEAAIQPVIFSAAFMNDLRRVVRRVVHPRLIVKIDEEKFKKNIPASVSSDETKLADYMVAFMSDLETKVNDLKPEDALVYFDSIGVELLNNGNITLDKEWTALMDLANAKLSTGAKTLPSILGHGSGSANIASSETLLFMKNCAGVQGKLNEMYSKMLTLALRLFGQDVYVQFAYEPIDLRPDSELEAFKVMKQSRILEQLSLGFLEDDDASIQLTGKLTPAGFTPLSGTGFMQPGAAGAAAAAVNPHNGSTKGGGGGAGGAGQQKNKTTPSKAKGPQKKAEMALEMAHLRVDLDAALAAGDYEAAAELSAELADLVVAFSKVSYLGEVAAG